MAVPVDVINVDRNGADPMTPVAADPVEGNSVPNQGGTILILNNTDAAPHNITFVTPIEVGSYSVEDFVVQIAASTTLYFGEFPSNIFGHTLQFTADSALVTIQAYRAN